jgi:hypothetical protein
MNEARAIAFLSIAFSSLAFLSPRPSLSLLALERVGANEIKKSDDVNLESMLATCRDTESGKKRDNEQEQGRATTQDDAKYSLVG